MSLEALFDNMSGFKQDLMAYGTRGAGAVAGIVGYNYLFDMGAKFLPASMAKYIPHLKSAGAIVVGILGGQYVARKVNHNVGQGIAVGLSAAGVIGLVNALAGTQLASAGVKLPPMLSGVRLSGRPALRGAPVEVEEINGAPVSVETVAGLHGGVERVFGG